MPSPSGRLRSLPPYPFADLPVIRRELRAKGVDVIDLGVGDADLPPPAAAVEALRTQAADPLNSRYSFQLGLPAFREAAASFMEQRFRVKLDPYLEILPLIGSKEGIFHLPFALLDPGDATILPDPGYQAYVGGTVLAAGHPHAVPLAPENDFLIPLRELPRDVVSRAKILFLNYPNNPTTAVAPLAYLQDAVAFCRENGIVLAYDNAYSEIAYDGYVPPSIFEIDGAREVAVEFHSLSKTYNMTGWRVGWAAGDAGLIAALAKVKSFADTGVPFLVQHAATAALTTRAEWLPGNVQVFRSRRDAALGALRSAGLEVSTPKATMYLWVAVPGEEGAEGFARRLLRDQGVAVMPGTSLGAGGEGFFRIALTVSEERLSEAADRIGRIL